MTQKKCPHCNGVGQVSGLHCSICSRTGKVDVTLVHECPGCTITIDYSKMNLPLVEGPPPPNVFLPLPDTKRPLYQKFDVKRIHDPEGKHKECFFFVLDMEHDKHAIPALMAYADSCRNEYPLLARDLYDIIERYR